MKNHLKILSTLILTLSGTLTFASPRYATLPLSFEPNKGQAPAPARFVARGAQYSVLMQDRGPILNLTNGHGERRQLGISFAGAQPSAPIASQPLAATVNYFMGKERSKWIGGLPTFAQVTYQGVYPGIDIVYYGQQRQLEYDFNVAPHADPSRIRMHFEGAGRAQLAKDGSLSFGDTFLQHRPLAYQLSGTTRVRVQADYELHPNGDVGLRIGYYDHSAPLVIDPTLSYSSFLGGSGTDSVMSTKVDATGALYVAGFSSSTSFKTTAGSFQTNYKGRVASDEFYGFGDAFVAKFSPAGALVFSTYLGGSNDDVASGVALDTAGNVYVAGATKSSDFPTTPGAFQTRFGGFVPDSFFARGDAFVVKLTPDGSKLVYGTYIGGSLNEAAWNLTVDSAGNATIVGNTFSTNFPTTPTAISQSYRGAANSAVTAMGDGFVTRLNAAGSALLYSSYIGGSGHDMARGVAVDNSGNTFVCGFTYSPDFPVTAGAAQTRFRGVVSSSYDAAADDGFLMKIGPSGAAVYSTYIGGSFRDGCFAVAVDSAGAAYITGRTMSTDFPVTSGAPRTNYGGSSGSGGDAVKGDAFVAKMNPAGTALVYSTYLGGSADDAGADIAVDAAGNAYITGFTLSSNFPLTPDALQKTFGGLGGQGFDAGGPNGQIQIGFGDAFLTKLDPQGALIYSSYFGGSQDDGGTSLAVDSAGNVYVGGSTLSTNLPMANAAQPTYGGTGSLSPRGDGFIARFDFGGKIGPIAAQISFAVDSPNTGSAGAALATPITVQVLDSTKAPIAGALITFSATNASVTPATATTDSNGRASTRVTLGSTTGPARITATVPGLPAINLDLTVTAAPAGPAVSAVANGASFSTTEIAPGSWITVYGAGWNPARNDASAVPLPLMLGEVSILVNGRPIPLLVVLPNQINAQLPYDTPVGTNSLVVRSGAVTSPSFSFPVVAAAPGIFSFGINRAVAQNVGDDGSLTLNTADSPVKPTKSMVVYFTGQGALDNPVATGDVAIAAPLSRPTAPSSVTVGGLPAIVDFLGMTPGQISLGQANIRIPADIAVAGDYDIVITIGGRKTPPRVVTVKP